MTTTPAPRRMVDVSGEEAWYLLGGASQGRMMYEQRDAIAVRPGSHVLEYGRLIVRSPVPQAALSGRVSVTYHCDHLRPGTGTGWAVTATGLAELVTNPDEAAHYRRALPGWSHGPHDALLRIHPQTVTGFRFAHAPDGSATARGTSRPAVS
ncbi:MULTISPECIES: pyridoxamine 5'-phosphate oxidase family protein [Streptomyces]|uniref:Pyridoxamine 5'-phosphate oxidase family protein n=1 Tax=Streptomyces nondiastaticus TaxID=3154512 RepID=A0ABW6U2M0_9ACTN|nr:pyridoxamine 5'-phosphate oxidase family protein [Streptomyces sp. VNUA116]WKU42991.1 pyridoxamine 5'-phosphate oxidase family protein [Streptomyces sp. VNUA116]